jgi:acyl dehydratase/NAD(P)-dependent dehydrogenase (short-subunit alcohol dehydrogenase family)
MTKAAFNVTVTEKDALAFANFSGDWTPLHSDPEYATTTKMGRLVLHGAFSAGLMSRLAGMNIPGRKCLLLNMKLRFLTPILPPANLTVEGILTGVDRVNVTIFDAEQRTPYVEGEYTFTTHGKTDVAKSPKLDVAPPAEEAISTEFPILVTGANGGMGQAVLERLGNKGVALSRPAVMGQTCSGPFDDVDRIIGNKKIAGIIHCGWPTPDKNSLLEISNPLTEISHHMASPVNDMITAAQLLQEKGIDGAFLLLVGSTFAEPGHHQYRSPLYSLSKSLIPNITKILGLELGVNGKRCISVIFDVIEGGMNRGLSEVALLSNADRMPSGRLATMEEAAEQLLWVAENQSRLLSGAAISFSGGSLP